MDRVNRVKMKANPGAPVPPDQVVGSNELISDLWDRLEQQSLVLTAERRIGKTLIIQKMKAEPREGKLTVFHDLEHVRTPIEFASAIFQDIEQYLSRSGQSAQRVRKLIKNVAGAELEGLGVRLKLPAIAASHWKEVIIQTFEDLVDHQGESVQAILFWDEVPWMLQEIAHTVGQDGATEVLDTLRSIRQTFPSVRMVFTGSVGLHHVRDRFRDSGYTNPSTNDMYVVDVPPLKVDDATELACQLLLGEHVAIKGSEDPLSIATAVAESVDSIPYYIHHLVVRLKSLHQPIDTMTVEREVNQACTERSMATPTLSNSAQKLLSPSRSV